MKIYFAGGFSFDRQFNIQIENALESYFYLPKSFKNKPDGIKRWFLDSGAFSAWSKGVNINLAEYINFIIIHEKEMEVYSVLDDIKSWERTLENQKEMEHYGLNPLPVYHWGEPLHVFESYLEKYDYIALGGMVPISSKKLKPWLDSLWEKICDNKGNPRRKIHGFGMTTLKLVELYPWYSIDSTSGILSGAMGNVYHKDGMINYSQKKAIAYALTQVKYKGYTHEELRDSYKIRIKLNIEYFLEIEKRMTENPPKFINNQLKLL